MPIAPDRELSDLHVSPPELDLMPGRASVLTPHAPPLIHYDSVIPPVADRPHEIESATLTDPVSKPRPAHPLGLFRLSAWCLGLFVAVLVFQLIAVGLTAAIGFVISAEIPFTPSQRYREVWRFESMPRDDSAARQWFKEREKGKPAVVTRKGLRLEVEYNRTDRNGPQRPEWEQFGYAKAYLQSSAQLSGGAAKVFFVYGALLGVLFAGLLFSKGQRQHWPLWPRTEGVSRRLLLVSVGTGLAGLAFAGLFVKVLAITGSKVPERELFSGLSLGQLLWMIPAIGVIGPIAEEILFRRVMFGRFLRAGRPVAGILVTSLVFGLAHGSVPLFPIYFVYGILFSLLLWRKDDLRAPILAHASINLAASIWMVFATTL